MLRASHPTSSVDLQGNTAKWLGLLYPGMACKIIIYYTGKFHRRRVSSQESDLVRASTPPPLIGNIIWCKLLQVSGNISPYISNNTYGEQKCINGKW